MNMPAARDPQISDAMRSDKIISDEIIYKDPKEFTPAELERLFRSVGWISAEYPERLATAMANSSSVFSVWAGELLIGLTNVLDDGTLTAYVHYLLIDPRFHGLGIGAELVRRIKAKYHDYLYILLIPEDRQNVAFYEKFGFQVTEGATPMDITNR